LTWLRSELGSDGRQHLDATSGTPEAGESAIRQAERRRISRELHDSTSQLLVALQLQLGELRRSRVATAESLLDEMDQVIRDIHDSISLISRRKSGEDEDADGPQIEVAKMFYSIGALTVPANAAGESG
jgi:hypothetical protein